jgi:tRNA dimethylallyltransferase
MKYFIKAYGCQMNESDSQRIASFLEQQHYRLTDKIEEADLVVVMACSVRQSAIDRIFGLKKKLKNLKAKKILTGCALKPDRPKFLSFFDEVLPIDEFIGKKYLELQPKYINTKSALVPIMTGCNNFCSYCVVPYTRGKEISRPAENIIKEIKNLVKGGFKEIILLGQNVNSYKSETRISNFETNSNFKNSKIESKFKIQNSKLITFPMLLEMINNIPGNFTIKFLTSHPKDISDELIDIIADSPKISKEIHLPVQSGDDEILRKMNRQYTIKQYLNLIEKIKTKIPEAKISTDVIVGFPGETKKQFQNTIKLFKKVGFSLAYINKYSTRLGTAAAQFKDNVPLVEKKRRWKILEKMVNAKPKLIIVLGPTASGKSDLAVRIAKKYNGEIISADSRQIYKEMDIGTAKLFQNKKSKIKNKKYLIKGVSHHLIDIATPKKQFTVAEYRKLALKAIDKIYKKNKIPILCGGTGFYIRAVAEGLNIPKVKPDWKLRKELEKKTEKELFVQLKKLDPNRAKNIDFQNKRRLIRAIEIILKTKKPIPYLKSEPQFDVLYLGIKKSLPELKKSINKRVDKMMKMGLEREVKNLIKKYGWTTVLKNTIGYTEFRELMKFNFINNAIKSHTLQFAKRQLTWFKKYPGKKISWVKSPAQAEKLVREFLL